MLSHLGICFDEFEFELNFILLGMQGSHQEAATNVGESVGRDSVLEPSCNQQEPSSSEEEVEEEAEQQSLEVVEEAQEGTEVSCL